MNNKTKPTLRAALPVWAKIGVMSFGGPAAQIALMHREIVEQRGWLSEDQFLNATGFCMLLPGPEAMQIATYAGWRMHGVRGGIMAGGLFVLPGALVIMALAVLYGALGSVPLVQALFLGVQAAVIAIVIQALYGLSRRALRDPIDWALAGFGFLALFVFGAPFPLVILLAALMGALLAKATPALGHAPLVHSALLGNLVIWGGLWAAPLLVIWLVDPGGLLWQVGVFFSKLAVVTFGGAYAVLAYMAQQVVVEFGWLSAGEMLDGLGLAETTPGPLILVTQFVGFLAGFHQGGLAVALGAGLLTLWVTFVPCFLWIFALAPYVEWVAGQPRLRGALAGITAAVVGVIANLSLWFALHVLFGEVMRIDFGCVQSWWPSWSSLRPVPLAFTVAALVALLRLRWSLPVVLGVAGLANVALHALGL